MSDQLQERFSAADFSHYWAHVESMTGSDQRHKFADPVFAAAQAARMKARNHKRWHLNRGIVAATCALCCGA
jgi:hypothetical protein